MARSEQARIRVVSAEIVEDGRYLLTQRLPTASLPLLWEFPGGRVRSGERDEEALQRCLEDRIGTSGLVESLLMEVDHGYHGYDLVLSVYRVRLAGRPRANRVNALAWVPPEEFGGYRFPGADQKSIDALLFGKGEDR